MENHDYQLINDFYTAFQHQDAEGMVRCYHERVVFEDPAFGVLKGRDAHDMWRMLVERSDGKLAISFGNIEADQSKGRADWEARYVFAQTGRSVHNKIAARFEFAEGRIISHKDSFNFWKWSAMALGTPGILLGFTPFLKNKVRKQCLKLLKNYQKNR